MSIAFSTAVLPHMNPILNILNFLFFVLNVSSARSHLAKVVESKQDGDLKMEPLEVIVSAGANFSFTCFYPKNVIILWNFTSRIHSFNMMRGAFLSNRTLIYFSKITVYGAKKFMSGEITCLVDNGDSRAVGFLTVKGAQIGDTCDYTSDCVTGRALCQDGLCKCPNDYPAHLQLAENENDVCSKMIYSLYDPCESNEQCSLLVDPKSVCDLVCVCAPDAPDKKGRCSSTEVSKNRNQEMYRLGITLSVSCIIILIVVMCLCVMLKCVCRYRPGGGDGFVSATRTSVNLPQRRYFRRNSFWQTSLL